MRTGGHRSATARVAALAVLGTQEARDRWMDGCGMGWHGGTADGTGRTGDQKECIIQMSQSKRGFKAGSQSSRGGGGAAGGGGVQHAVLCCADMARRAFPRPAPTCARRRASTQRDKLGSGSAQPRRAVARAGLLAGAEPTSRAGAEGCKARAWVVVAAGLRPRTQAGRSDHAASRLRPWPRGSAPRSCRRWPREWGRGRT